jgi:hypothetical protein
MSASTLHQTSHEVKPTPEACHLYRTGYRIKADTRNGFFWFLIIKPNGECYRINAVEMRCTCPAWGVCKHLRQLRTLVRDCWCRMDSGLTDAECFDLMSEWESAQMYLEEGRAIAA